jgi:hypothetical protein
MSNEGQHYVCKIPNPDLEIYFLDLGKTPKLPIENI